MSGAKMRIHGKAGPAGERTLVRVCRTHSVRPLPVRGNEARTTTLDTSLWARNSTIPPNSGLCTSAVRGTVMPRAPDQPTAGWLPGKGSPERTAGKGRRQQPASHIVPAIQQSVHETIREGSRPPDQPKSRNYRRQGPSAAAGVAYPAARPETADGAGRGCDLDDRSVERRRNPVWSLGRSFARTHRRGMGEQWGDLQAGLERYAKEYAEQFGEVVRRAQTVRELIQFHKYFR